ncbi:MAG: hypothetical protein J6Y60_02465 [Treponema sp.]|nr:hypothetical protein [Treponema sp.]
MKYIRARTKRFFLPLVFGTVFLFSFFSCSDSETRITGLFSTTVLDYADWESFPTARLSVFAETTLDERAADEIKITHNQSGLVWQCKNPRKIASTKNSTWAGYTNFVPVQGSYIPQGNYSISYVDMAGQECQSIFTVSYPEELLETTAAEFNDMKIDREENIALYDPEGQLIYYGERKDSWTSNSEIRKTYGVAEKIRICYRLSNGRTVCMMPVENL